MTTPFTIQIAGQRVAVSALFPSTREYCRDYLTEELPEFALSISWEDIEWEREKSAREDRVEGHPVRPFSDEYLETLAVYRKLAGKLLACDVLLFHGSVVAVDGQGYLFAAKSGTGKSTHTRLWREQFGERAVMVNDDKPLLKLTEHGVLAYGTPWDGKHRLSSPISVPLRAICLLERGEENRIEPICPQEALPMLVQQTHRPSDPALLQTTLQLIDRLSKSVDFYRLRCNMDPSAARVAYQGMQRP
jgi:hypothetical protein